MAPSRSQIRSRPLIERLWRRPLPLHWRPVWAALVPAATVYSGIVKLRERWWRTRSARIGVPLISVGNLTVGGNGKTPFTLFLASRLIARGFAVAIVSRGWGRSNGRSNPLLVSDGSGPLCTPRAAGDEPVMMARSFRGPIAVSRRRIDAIKLLCAHHPLDTLILDDGFQHLRLHRDLNLLLVNAARGFGNGWVLPAGPLREERTAMTRADAIIVIDSRASPDFSQRDPTVSDLALPEEVPIFRARIRPRALVHADAVGWLEGPLALSGRRVIAISGLADPSSFHAMLRELGATIVVAFEFSDHHDYTPQDFAKVLAAAAGADLIVTTEKDLVKLELFPTPGVSLYALRLDVSMDSGDEERLLDLAAARIRTGVIAAASRAAGSASN
jgi:tetraacyldisaccharide 4'-kinase